MNEKNVGLEKTRRRQGKELETCSQIQTSRRSNRQTDAFLSATEMRYKTFGAERQLTI